MLTKDDYHGIEKLMKRNLRGYVRRKDLSATESRLLKSINRLTDAVDNRFMDTEERLDKVEQRLSLPSTS